MYEDTANAETKSEATPLHELYAGQVDLFTRPYYWTISPDPRTYDGYTKGHEYWTSEIRRIMYHTCNDYLYTLELAGLRPHYHGVCDVKDLIGFNTKMFNASRYDNIKIHGKFKDGLKYMFKSVSDTYDRTGIIPIRERDDDVEYKKQQQSIREESKRKFIIDIVDRDIPEWMKQIE